MSDATEIVQQWLTKADHDLISAKQLGLGPQPLLDTAVYHCQQAAEKALKAAIAWKGRPLLKTHDLRVLLDIVAKELPALEAHREATEILTPFATAYRYPGVLSEPDADEFQEALLAAECILDAVKTVIGSH